MENDYVYDDTAGLKHLNSVRDGSFKLGLGIGCDLDKHLRYKKSGIVVMAGHANVGKTLSILWYFTCLAKIHGLKFVIFSSENEIGSLKDDLITMYTGQTIKSLSKSDFDYAYYWLSEHFKFINADGFFKVNKRLIHYIDILELVDSMPIDYNFRPDSFVIDPYNSLGRAEDKPTQQHLYDYTVMAEVRIYCKLNKKSCYILAHGVTEALRKTHPKGHDFEGHSIPLMSADIEGGGKFVNRSDDYVNIHRYTTHKTEWFKTEWHVAKIKNTKTGGRPTFKDNPVILRALPDLVGFDVYIKEENFAEPATFKNPLTGIEKKEEPKKLEPNTKFEDTIKHAQNSIQDEKDSFNEIQF